MVSKSMLNSLLQKQLGYAPEPQPFYTFHDHWWTSKTSLVDPDETAPPDAPLRSLHLINWSIDFMASEPRARMAAAINHLKGVLSGIPSSSAVVILLQEMMEGSKPGNTSAGDLSQLAETPWIRERFNITDISSDKWDASYGQVTLVDRRLPIAQVSRLHFVSEYQRDAILVDISLASEEPGKVDDVLRICNVHLDSLYGSMRPVQWKGAAKHLQNVCAASILAGDCNANQPRDCTDPQENGFRDVYLELGGIEGDEEGATWGFQSKQNRWGKKRLDKQVFWGDVEIESLQRIGIGVEVEDEGAKQALERQEELPFATDHFGLLGEYTIRRGFKVKNSKI